MHLQLQNMSNQSKNPFCIHSTSSIWRLLKQRNRYFIFSLPFLLILWHWEEVLVVWNRLELSSGSSDQLNQPAGPSYPILTTVPRGITLKKRKKQRHVMQLLYFPLWHFNHKKMFEYPINLVPFIIFSEETCAASCAQLLSQTAGVKNSQLLKMCPNITVNTGKRILD